MGILRRPLESGKSLLQSRRSADMRKIVIIWIVVGYVFANSRTATLYVPVGTTEAYKAAVGWKEFKNIVEMEF
ncbi:MAG: hypothetical protein K2G66_03415 [Alistipes sp.]|nr:hypothetical protein [Alistipes sp.]